MTTKSTGETGNSGNNDTTEALPDRISADDHHENCLTEGIHPVIEMGDSFWGDVANSVEHGVSINDADRLIGFMERNRCPICGRTGRLRLRNNFTFARGVTSREFEDGGGTTRNPVVERLEDEGYCPIVCRSGPNNYYVGVAAPNAIEEYEEWRDGEAEREEFKSTARELVDLDAPEKVLDGQYSHGHLLAAIFEELGAESYDSRELMGRRHVTKGQLAAILVRIRSMDVTERTSYTEHDWLVVQDFGVTNGAVEWHIPEWVDFDGLRYSDHYKTDLFE